MDKAKESLDDFAKKVGFNCGIIILPDLVSGTNVEAVMWRKTVEAGGILALLQAYIYSALSFWLSFKTLIKQDDNRKQIAGIGLAVFAQPFFSSCSTADLCVCVSQALTAVSHPFCLASYRNH